VNAFGNTLRKFWELDGNTLGIREKNKKIPLSLSQRKKLDHSQMHAEPFYWLHENSLSKTVCHHFSPRLMVGAEF
jgi:hypothetical protein